MQHFGVLYIHVSYSSSLPMHTILGLLPSHQINCVLQDGTPRTKKNVVSPGRRGQYVGGKCTKYSVVCPPQIGKCLFLFENHELRKE